ncbi:CgeB family protein [Alteromonas genovensis]|uniref:CgeB family protein n=1 Tax=Alteromonas genovensis TaxID=471225 RepID=UPI002FDF4526
MTSESIIKHFQIAISNCEPVNLPLIKKRVLIVAPSDILYTEQYASISYHNFAKSFVAEGFEVLFLTLTSSLKLSVKNVFDDSFEKTINKVRYFNGDSLTANLQEGIGFFELTKILDDFIDVYRPSIVIGLKDDRLQLPAIVAAKKIGASYFKEQMSPDSEPSVYEHVSRLFSLEQNLVKASLINVALKSKTSSNFLTENGVTNEALFNITPLFDLGEDEKSGNIVHLTGKLSGIFSVKEIELSSSKPSWYSLDVSKLKNIQIQANVEYKNLADVFDKKAVLLLKVLDESGNELSKNLSKLAYSSKLGAKFKYIPCSHGEGVSLHEMDIPNKASTLQIGFSAFNCVAEQSVKLTALDIDFTRRILDDQFPSLISSKPLTYTFDVDELLPHTIKANLTFESNKDKIDKALIAGVTYFDENNNIISPPYIGLLPSKTVGPCIYLNTHNEDVFTLVPPRNAKRADVRIQIWHAKHKVWLNEKIKCKPEITKNNTQNSLTKTSKYSELAKPLSKVKVAAILDEFTLECFRMEVDLISVSPTNWEHELDTSDPDFLFVESCWFGNKNQWGGLMYGYTSNGPNQMGALIQVLNYCKKKAIPTVFWSKEDPVHYTRFGPTAKLFDYVFTTDANMISSYRKDFGLDVEAMSFFCQPKVHNPVELIPRVSKAAFAGSYYSDKKERCDDFHAVLGALDSTGVEYDIYDRCLKRGVSSLQFPEYFKKHVVGYLEPDEMWKAYKGYKYTVNMNTVKHSPTMFARRVYESLASGTPVISNYSEGVVTQFSGIVCASDSKQKIADYLEMLKDDKEYKRIKDEGVRETLGRHTIADRLEQVCKRVGIAVIPHLPVVNAVITAGSVEMVERARTLVKSQSYFDKRLVVNLENSNELYPYLNMNSDREIFRVLTEFAKPLEGVDVELDLNEEVESTLMEDVAIQTQYKGAELDNSEKKK